MASIGSSLLPASALLTSPSVINFVVTNANTEYQLDIPAGVKNFTLQNRDEGTVKIATGIGQSNTLYLTIFPGRIYNIENLTGSAIVSLYIQSTKANQTLEIFTWG